MGDLNYFVQRVRQYTDELNMGYDQSNRWDFRWGGECDCSSLVIQCLQEAGFDTGDASYTGNLSSNLTARGWVRLSPDGDPQVGDILLNDEHHVATCTAPGQMSYASIDENGNISGGEGGDQTDRETRTVDGFYYSRGWDCYLRYTGGDSSSSSVENNNYYSSNSGSEFDLATLGILRKGDTGNTVKAMQILLCGYGYGVGPDGCDGEFGDNTENALKCFQQSCNIDIDGECGPITWGKLLL